MGRGGGERGCGECEGVRGQKVELLGVAGVGHLGCSAKDSIETYLLFPELHTHTHTQDEH